ncbi:MAG: hypothetical protein A2Z20_04970 [Bdellovibrionales bacterium RBG_16_40_8]|nr:MAG: hypothetical protein A2Z20_04970 [Bdellovibrionales bacterium RBG_16_40_8]
MKTYDEMSNRVKKRIIVAEKKAETDPDSAKANLKDALQLIFSRPNSDNMVSQLVPTVKSRLKNFASYESTVDEIVTATLDEIKKTKSAANKQATSLIILENILSEFKPDVKNNKVVKVFFEKIRNAKIEVSSKVKTEFRMRSMLKPPASPSAVAEKILNGTN